MNSVNVVILLGRLTADPELTETNGGTTICKFSIAVEKFKTSDKEQSADFFQIVTFNKIAENCSKFLKKGSQIIVEGSIHSKSWENKDKKRQYSVEINSSKITFISTKNASDIKINKEEDQNIINEPINDSTLPF